MSKETKDKKKSSLLLSAIGWGGLLIIFFLIRHFLVQSYHISTSSMEEALLPGDFVLVNKWHSKNNPGRNRIILFSSPLLKDTVDKPLLLSRCIAMPGDLLEVTKEEMLINGHLLPHSPQGLQQYKISPLLEEKFSRITQQLKLPRRNREVREGELLATLTSFEEYMIREELTPEENGLFTRIIPETYKITIPRKDIPYRLDSLNVYLFRNAIVSEIGEQAFFRDNKLFIEGKESSYFTFRQNYYWVLSDNNIESVDSRHLGLIPEDHIIGNVWFRWYGKNKNQWLTWIK